jgi:hypothetical protein
MWAALDDLAVIVTSVPVIVAFMFSVGISATLIIVTVRLGLASPVIIPILWLPLCMVVIGVIGRLCNMLF